MSIQGDGSEYAEYKRLDEEEPIVASEDPLEESPDPEDYHPASGDEYDRYPKPPVKKKTGVRVTHSWRAVTVLTIVLTMLSFLTLMILEYNIDSKGAFCSDDGLTIIDSETHFFSDCFREMVFFLPSVLTLLISATFYLASRTPWFMRRVAPRSTAFLRVKFVMCVLATVLPLLRLFVRAFSFSYTRADDPSVMSAADGIELFTWMIVNTVVYFDWVTGHGHLMFMRYFWWFGCFNSFVKVITLSLFLQKGYSFDSTDALYFASFAVYAVLSVLAIMGWREGKHEIAGNTQHTKKRRKGFPPLWQVWDLMKEDRVLLMIGLGLSACQGVLLSFALLASSELMGGEIKDRDQASRQLGEFLGYSFAVAISTSFQQGIFGVSGQRIKNRMKSLMFKNFLLQDAAFLHKKENDTGALTSRLLTDTERFGGAVTTQLSAIMRPLSQAVIGTGFLFSISWRLTLVVMLMALILILISIVRSSAITVKYSRLYSDQIARVSSKGVEVIKGIEAVHQYSQEKNEHIAFSNILQRVYAVGVGKELRESVFEGLEHLLLSSILGTGLWYGSVLVVEGNLRESDLISFALITGAVVTSIESIMKIIPEFLDVAGPALRVCELINSKTTWDFDQPEEGFVPEKLEGKIEFDNVTFFYPGAAKKTLGPGLNISVKGGDSVALVGESGCGKSTCISLVQRQYHVRGIVDGFKPLDRGEVRLDGRDIRTLRRSWVMDQIGVVAQKAIMWNTTIWENVAYGKPSERYTVHDGTPEREAQRLRVIQALKDAAAWDEFVNPNPPLRPDGTKPEPGLGLDFQVGEDGSNLSGGQKQRVSIARMLYKNPSLYIFDEVTSALDAGSEKNVMSTLIQLSQQKTCLMIAHRLNTIKHADHVVVLSKKGNVLEETRTRPRSQQDPEHKAEEGSSPTAELISAHEQLLQNPGYYKKMWDNQTF